MAHNPFHVARSPLEVVIVGDFRIEVQLANLLRHRSDLLANDDWHRFYRTVSPDKPKGFFGTDPFHASVEVGADEDTQIDELQARNTEHGEHAIQVNELRRDRTKGTAAWKKFLAGNRQEPHDPRCAEEQRIIVFAGRRP